MRYDIVRQQRVTPRPQRGRQRSRTADTKADRFVTLRKAMVADDRLSAAQRRESLSQLADAWLARFFSQASAVGSTGTSLVAVGGYGRQEVLPGSDLDVLLLMKDADQAGALAEKVFYPVWDAGIPLDHSVRTIGETVQVASADIKVALGLIDARHIAGDSELTTQLRADVLANWRRQATTRLPELAAMCRERAARIGELSHLLEPDLVQAYGGLRDTLALRAVAASWVADRPHTTGVEEARQWLLTVRDALHRTTRRRDDRLLFDHQSAVAERLELLDPDALLRRVAEAGRRIAYASDVTWREVERTLAARRRKLRAARPVRRRPLTDGIVEHDGEAVLARDVRLDSNTTLPIRAAAAAAQAGVALGPHTVERIAAECPPLPNPWPTAARDALVSLLGAGHQAVEVWESLDAAGLVVQWFPEWDRIRYRPTRTPVHRHTVDRHLVESAVVASGLTRQVSRPDLLLLAALFHDLGKGVPGDHSMTGESIAYVIGRRIGLTEEDSVTLARLVRHHLLLPQMATRRDPDDPATMRAVVDAVGTREFLDLLAALTESDASAAGPVAWSPLRARLIHDLVARARGVLDGSPPPKPPRLAPWQAELAKRGELAVRRGPVDGSDSGTAEGAAPGRELTVVAPDAPGLLGTVAGVLALNRLSVRKARTFTAGGMAVLSWQVELPHGREPTVERLRDDVDRSLRGSLDVDARLAARASERAGRVIVHASPHVDVLPEASADATVLEVRAHDQPGLLHRLGGAITSFGVVIRSAVVETLGSEAIDVFYLVDADGAPLGPIATSHVIGAVSTVLSE